MKKMRPAQNKPRRQAYDGYQRLAAAVILKAVRDCLDAPSLQQREAQRFLGSDMYPWWDVLDLAHECADLGAIRARGEKILP